ncbi:patatin-like phospholipase family protein [Tepidibacter hydrothermalis]|uniref:Patatin family protein n=1 Tax=Tepidibacter hydrothermalis TaxID=3036126 RepID=A0ABY8EDW4_9FIRM|nr:patatin family protein [Tepidibacter hydrothermalis]WFD11138.1 patatin family protein [Tepidibacter hydrothermalis]
MKNIGLILPGGGMRGVYTSGVIDFFIEKNLRFPYTIGVSAGACNGSAYISNQHGFGKILYTKYLNDKRYFDLRNLFRQNKTVLGMDFIFDEIPNKLELFDFDSFNKAPEKLIITTTNCVNGESVYIDRHNCDDLLKVIRASCSLPFVSPIVEYDKMQLLDGGISDPIPIKKSQNDGNNKNIVILTSQEESSKKPRYLKRLAKKFYTDNITLVEAIDNCYDVYNDSLKYVSEQQKNGKAFVISPSQPVKLNTLDKNYKNINSLYELGYKDASNSYNKMIDYIKN